MITRETESAPNDSKETSVSPARAFMCLAATALSACVAVGVVKGYETYQDLQHPQYELELDKLVGGTP